VNDTLKRSDDDLNVLATVDRQYLWRAQTPQGFRREILVSALESDLDFKATDEASLVEAMGLSVKIVEGAETNFKITREEDLTMAQLLLSSSVLSGSSYRASSVAPFLEEKEAVGRPSALSEAAWPRVGQGWDFHPLDPNRPLWLGCLLIPELPGLAGHSDADVLVHSLIDALLGAANLGDIGSFFPPEDERWRGSAGADLLRKAYRRVKMAGYSLVNADLTLIGPKPRISVYRQAMVEAISNSMDEDPRLFNIKGKTTEGLGFVGRGEGLAASSAVLLRLMS
jgi:2-C-methyl-D-erythritol 2,4-cyclodiphosphate synthase